MADDKATSTSLLMDLPLEVRHTIFEYAAARDVKPKKLLRKWFEKKEVKGLVAQQVAADPNGPAPRVVQNNEYEEDSDVPQPEVEENPDSEDEDEEAYDGEINDDNNEEDQEDEVEQNQDQDRDEDDIEIDAEEAEDEDAIEGDQNPEAHDTPQPPTSVQSQPIPLQMNHFDELADEAQAGDGEAGTGETQEGDPATEDVQEEVDEDDGEEEADEDDGEEEADNDGDAGGTATAPPPPPPPIIRAARKWRYIPNFMRITQCPPPVELLLASKQLNDEAKNWFYDVAILRINATGSFAHTSFFEEAFSQIMEAAFSPMENVRKVEVTFVWDTTWLRADDTGCAEAIFPALLRQRSDFVYQILSQAPDLREVTIHWHDSAQDNESANFMLDILAPFHGLNANMKIEEHYISADAKPHKRSIAGKRRVEFQGIVDAGLDRLF